MGDLLTSYNGTSITYDNIGNPTQIGTSGEVGSISLAWQGRQLQSYTRYVMDMVDVYTETTTYTYNDEGIRTSKNVNGVLHEYIISGNQIVAEKNGNRYLVYLYDEIGAPIGMMYRENGYSQGVFETYIFDKNLQGDVVAIYNSDGEKIGSYEYDMWGKVFAHTESGTTTLERNIVNNYNPFRYRGYYYDVDTELYYLQSRYYNDNNCSNNCPKKLPRYIHSIYRIVSTIRKHIASQQTLTC